MTLVTFDVRLIEMGILSYIKIVVAGLRACVGFILGENVSYGYNWVKVESM